MHSGIVVLLVTFCTMWSALAQSPPRFAGSTPSSIFVHETEEVGYILGSLTAVDIDSETVFFALQDGSVGPPITSVAEIQTTGDKTADVVLKAPLNYEAVTDYDFYFTVTDQVSEAIRKSCVMFVLDVNDNAPQFEDQPYRAEIPENAEVGTSVFRVSAVDPDLGISGVITYSMQTIQDMFTINATTGVVKLSNQLSYSSQSFYQLAINAQDGGGLNSSTELVVTVTDVQGEPPFFLNLPYIAHVPENVDTGSTVLQVTAVDGDTGSPNDIQYSLISGNTGYFLIDELTGVITVRSDLNWQDPNISELFGVLTLTVQAAEVTASPQGLTTATAPVSVTVVDVNDQSPTFDHATYRGTVQENSQARIPITLQPEGQMEMIVRDYDKGDNARFELFLEKDGSPYDVFDIVPPSALNEATALIRVKNTSAIDYEINRIFTFEVVARETNTQDPHESRATVQVDIIDSNDHWPTFTDDLYQASIPENSPRSTSVITITASDLDSAEFRAITYSIRGASDDLFSVDPLTGYVTVAVDADLDHNLLDREKLDRHFLTYEAEDGGGLKTTVPLEIRLTDMNDNAPIVSRARYVAYVRENESELEIPVQIDATDLDLPPNSDLRYSLSGDDSALSAFLINPLTGELSINTPLDYEVLLQGRQVDPSVPWDGRLELLAEVHDLGSPSLSAQVVLEVYVQDVNDETPYFVHPDGYTAVISEAAPGGTSVSTVHALDNDGVAPNNEIIYRIDNGARDKFRIDAQTGEVTVESGASLDRDLYGDTYVLEVLAIDRGTPPLTGTTLVTITITDVNNKRPIFSPDRRSVSISESHPVTSSIFTYLATDLDASASLRYSLLDDRVEGEDEDKLQVRDQEYLASLFTIDSMSGVISVAAPLDRERAEEITLWVFVEDINADVPAQQNATAELTITLLDVNDNPPQFLPSDVYYARISEASRTGSEVKQVQAVDADKSHGIISYYMVPDSEQSQSFTITEDNRHTGMITLLQPVDHEAGSSVNLTVRAEDNATGANGDVAVLSSLATVIVELEDVNDNSPDWVDFSDHVTVEEDRAPQHVVTTVSARDTDSGLYGQVTYHITSGADNKFDINTDTGEIFVSGELDREDVAQYSLTIEARDNPGAPLSQQRKTSRQMVIDITDINDSAPRFEQEHYEATVLENARTGVTFARVRATDDDTGENSAILYSVNDSEGNATGLFNVVPGSGDVYVDAPLQGQMGIYQLVLSVHDQGSPPLFSNTSVYVTVEDVNDNQPQIITPAVNATYYIYENLGANQNVGITVHAVDEDQGLNGEIRYEFIQNPSDRYQDWRSFHIDSQSGVITTAINIDREAQLVYFLEVRAYDLGHHTYDDRRMIRIEVLDQDDNDPMFDRMLHPPPYHLTVLEEATGTLVGNVSLATDPDSGNNSIICYYIVGGSSSYRDSFSLHRSSGMLYLNNPLDHEQQTSVELVIQANRDCGTTYWDDVSHREVPWNVSDSSLMLIEVTVLDVNDNSPKFQKRWFTAGVTRDTQVGETVINLKDYTTDSDSAVNAIPHYYMYSPIHITEPLSSQITSTDKQPFILQQDEGLIITNMYFQQSMQGYFEFQVFVNNTKAPDNSVIGNHFYDIANVSIYLLNENQRVKVIIRGQPEEVGDFKDHFADYLSNITGAIINVDKIRTHKDASGISDDRRTDMFIHAINPETGEVYDAKYLLDIIDQKYSSLIELFNSYNVIRVVLAVEETTKSTVEDDLLIALIIVASALFLIIVLLSAAFCICRRKYKRKLRSANAMAFGDHRSIVPPVTGIQENGGLHHTDIPNTNLNMYEGGLWWDNNSYDYKSTSNPIWAECENGGNGWPPDLETERRRHSSGSSANTSPDQLALPSQDPNSKLYDEQVVSMALSYDESNNTHAHHNHITPTHQADQHHSPNHQNHVADHNGSVNTINGNGNHHIGNGTSENVLQTAIEKHKNNRNSAAHPHDTPTTPTTPTSQNHTPKHPPRPPPKTKPKTKSKQNSKRNGHVNHGYLEPIDAYESNYTPNGFAMNGYEVESTEI